MNILSLKRLFDVVLSTLLIVITLPFIAAGALLAMCDGHRNPFFTQVRIGKGLQHFTIFKLRTMHASTANSDAIVHFGTDSNTLTPIGRFLRKTSLDELPQLFNILRGDMTFIGPRPHAPEYAAHYAKIVPNYYDRYEVRPGLAGLVQVTALRNLAELPHHIQARVQSDLTYIRHMSFGLDIAIFLKAAVLVLAPIAPSTLESVQMAATRLIELTLPATGLQTLQVALMVSRG